MLTALSNEVAEHFGVSIGTEFVPFGEKFGLDFLIVLNDPVMDHGNFLFMVQMGVGITFNRYTVCGPTGMAYAECGVGHVFLSQLFIKGGQFAFGPDQLDFLVLYSGNTRRIVAAVFKTVSSLQQ